MRRLRLALRLAWGALRGQGVEVVMGYPDGETRVLGIVVAE